MMYKPKRLEACRPSLEKFKSELEHVKRTNDIENFILFFNGFQRKYLDKPLEEVEYLLDRFMYGDLNIDITAWLFWSRTSSYDMEFSNDW